MQLANLLLKTGADMSQGNEHVWQQLLNFRIFFGMLSFGIAMLIYIFILRQVPLNIAQSFMSAQFIAIIIASSIVLSEPISNPQWLGITLIAIGIAIVGFSQ